MQMAGLIIVLRYTWSCNYSIIIIFCVKPGDCDSHNKKCGIKKCMVGITKQINSI